ncbi:hypothetical protein ACWGQ9_03575 [Streptomyces parvus]
MVRRNQSSNPRTTVVLTSGSDWGTRAAVQSRSSGADLPLPRKQPAKLKALRQTIGVIRMALNAKRWHQARFGLSRAQALLNALPANLTTDERAQLTVLRKKFAARNTPAAADARKAKAAATAKRLVGKKPTPKPPAKKSATRMPPQQATPAPVRELGDRLINRAALGYDAGSRPRTR